MTRPQRHAASPGDFRALRSDTAWHLAGGLVVTLCISLLLGAQLGAPLLSAGLSLVLYLGVAGLVWWELPWHLPQRRFGAANRITLLRGTAILALAGLVLAPSPLRAQPWWPLGLATAALALDAVDGWFARREGTVSSFGAWFDQELDGFFILVLGLVAWRTGQAPAWVLLLGAYRYLFLLAGRIAPPLRAPLPFSRRRRFVCAFTITALVACLAPVLSPATTTGIAGAALALLSYSFAADVLSLFHHRRAAGAKK